MTTTSAKLRDDALAIWSAGVEAVRSDRLVMDTVRRDGDLLRLDDLAIRLNEVGRIAVVGCGKAGTGMADGIERALGEDVLEAKQVVGWVNVPDDCVRELKRVHLHGARPPGVNEPTEAGAAGATRILEIVQELLPEDLCICLISGGGSALLPAPVEGVTLDDKLAVTRHLSGAGANIQQLNTVRKQLSRIKGGGLARACRAGRMIALIISDVLGDPLDVIASGPTVPDTSTAREALEILERFEARQAGISERVFEYLTAKATGTGDWPGMLPCKVIDRIIGSNLTAVSAAAVEARRRGYRTESCSASQLEGAAEQIGRHLADQAMSLRSEPEPRCVISGGEPTVRLVAAAERGRGGRNQQLVLAALERLLASGEKTGRGIALLSGGTDGEDGPTDAAGAVLDERVLTAARSGHRQPADYLQRNDAYSFFAPLDALIHTGPTHTNVCDVRVVVTRSD